MAGEIGLTFGAFFISIVLIIAAKLLAIRRGWFDRPNDRSAHSTPTPRIGGVGIVLGFILAGAMLLERESALDDSVRITFAGAFGMAVLGFIDDVRSMRASFKLFVQVLIATIVLFLFHREHACRLVGDGGLRGAVEIVAGAIWIVWLTNLYNFMDGIDGLAGGQGVFAALAVGVAAFSTGDPALGWLMLVLAAATIGFLFFNFPPASVFMGDVGSTALGFIFGALPFTRLSSGIPPLVWVVALSLFVLDASVTLLRRLARRENVFRAHRSHYYQRPLALGIRHKHITLVSYTAMAVVGAVAAALPRLAGPSRLASALSPVVLFVVLASWVLLLERRAGR